MAILMRQEAPGMPPEVFAAQFAPLLAQMKTFPGFIAHASGPIPGGYQVTEVWESQDAHERWFREVVLPSGQQAGVSLDQLPPTQYQPLNFVATR